MKKLLIQLLLVGFSLGASLEASASDRWETLRAINWVENPTNHTHVGRFGELGPYQFRPATWRMHTDRPFRQAVERTAADEVAVKHYEWIRNAFERAGVEPNSFNIAMAWNCGVDAVVSGRAPSVSYGYAQRVSNLVESFKASQQEEAELDSALLEFETRSSAEEPVDGLRFRVLQDTPQFVLASN